MTTGFDATLQLPHLGWTHAESREALSVSVRRKPTSRPGAGAAQSVVLRMTMTSATDAPAAEVALTRGDEDKLS